MSDMPADYRPCMTRARSIVQGDYIAPTGIQSKVVDAVRGETHTQFVTEHCGSITIPNGDQGYDPDAYITVWASPNRYRLAGKAGL